MTIKTIRHFSHDFELNLNKKPVKNSDRMALRIVMPGILSGFILVLLGVYEFIIRTFPVESTQKFFPFSTAGHSSFLNPTFFDLILILLGFWIALALFASYIRYKKIVFIGKIFRVIDRPVFGKKKSFQEPLKNYNGVLFRIEFFQFGFLNRNKYIIELNHKDAKKTIPLYINTSEKNIRVLWEYYAQKLGMPALILTDQGILKRDVKDLNKSLIQMVKARKIIYDSKETKKAPRLIAYTRKSDKTIIKVRNILWDAYNVLTIGVVFILVLLLLAAAVGTSHALNLVSCAFALLLLGIVLFLLFRKDKIVVKKHKVIIVHKFMLFSRKRYEIMKKDIKSVDVPYNPALERHFLAISGNNRTLIFGQKLPLESLKWVRNFLISEIMK